MNCPYIFASAAVGINLTNPVASIRMFSIAITIIAVAAGDFMLCSYSA